MDLYIKFFFGIISAYAIVVLDFSIFKIPIKGNDKQIVLIATVVGVVNVYLKFVAHSNLFSVIQTVIYIILLSILRKYPLLYGTIVVLFGTIAASLIDGFISFSVLKIGLIKVDTAFADTGHFMALHSFFGFICLTLSWFLASKKVGFSFIKGKFKGNLYLKKSTYVWAIILILVMTSLQLGAQNFDIYTINSFMLLAAAAAFLVLIIYSYYQNKKSLNARYGEKMKVS
jgi:hypothetical protein